MIHPGVQQKIRGLAAIDRSGWLAGLGCAIALAAGLQWLPFTADELLARTVELQTLQGGPVSHVYGTLQGRPTETCAAFAERQPVVLADVERQLEVIKSETGLEVFRIRALMRVYTRDVRALYLSPPPDPSCWKEDTNYAYFQAGYPIDAPFIWITRRLGLSTMHVALALMAGSWLGVVCLFLAARRMARSAACGLAGVAALHYAWEAWSLPGGAYFFSFNAFVPLYAGQLLASPGPLVRGNNRPWQWGIEALLIAAVALHALLQVFVYPFTHRINATVILLVVGLVGLLLRDKRVLLRAGILAIALQLVMQPYLSDSKQHHAQLTNLNLAAGQGFTNVMLAMGMFERPTYLGLPNGDYAFGWIRWMDPYLQATAPHLVVHQSLDRSGRTLLFETLREHPGAFAEALWKRLFIQTVYHRELNQPWYYQNDGPAGRRSALFLAALAVVTAVVVASLAWPATWPLVWPGAALTVWHLFGVNTLLTMVHLHVLYVFSGLFLMLALAPALVVCVWRHRRDAVWSPLVAGRRLITSVGHRPVVAAVVILLLVVLTVTGMRYGMREARKELGAFRLWYAIHYAADFGPIGQAAWRSPAQLAEMVRGLQALGHEPPGAVEIYGAWVFWVYNYQNGLYKRGPATNDPALQARFKGQADSYILSYYREALRQAPDNPHFGTYALMINDPEWPAIFRRTLEAFPDHHHATYMAYHLIGQEGEPRRAEVIGAFERGVARELAASAATRPGYVRLPAISGVPVVTDAAGLVVELNDGQEAQLPAIPLRGAPVLRLALYLESRSGVVQLAARVNGQAPPEPCTSTFVSPETPLHYTYVDCRGLEHAESVQLTLTARAGNATVVARDYYPMFSIVRLPQ